MLAAAFAVPSAAHAAKTPTVEIGVSQNAITVAGAQDLGRGAVRLQVSAEDLGEPRTVAVIELRRGARRADVDDADLAGLDDAAQAERFGRLVAGGVVTDDHAYATTIRARAREYVVVDVTAQDGASAAFHVDDTPSGARPGRSDASIRLRDDGLTVPRSLPREGFIRVANTGGIAHQLTAFRIKHGVSNAKAVRALRNGHPDRIGSATVSPVSSPPTPSTASRSGSAPDATSSPRSTAP